MIWQKLKNIYHFANAFLAVFYYGYPAKDLEVIGVTGTDGKTTTSTIIYHLLNSSGRKAALITTVAAYIGDNQIDTGFHTTTPNPWVLQKLIKKIKDQGIKFLVLESTSHGLDQHRLLGCNYKVGVITNITHEHLDYHKNPDNYLKAKAKLLKKSKYAVLNLTDSSFEKLKSRLNKMVITYSDKDIPKFVKDKFNQDYNQLNAQAAIKVARIFNLDEDDIKKAILSFEGVKGRVEKVPNKFGLNIVVDFAHTPNAIDKVLTSLKSQTQGKLIAVFGATGRRDVAKRPKMGQLASQIADLIVLTADDCYDEDVNKIINQIKSGITKNHQNIISFTDRQKAIDYAILRARKGDTIAILGQGHEQSINLDGKTETPWSDVKAAKKALKLKSNKITK
jgi:UDP-N-acetylmuramoyl-L-alanyl-D-glutamate--2,6-diaminopimelate ligase